MEIELRKLLIMFLWFWVPVICIGLGVKLPQWYSSVSYTPTQRDSWKDTHEAWQYSIITNPDLKWHTVDNPKHNLSAEELTAIKNSNRTYYTQLNDLFPNFHGGNLYYANEAGKENLQLQKAGSTTFFSKIERDRFGNYILSNDQGDFVRLGELQGSERTANFDCLNLPSTIVTVVCIITFLMCLGGVVFAFPVNVFFSTWLSYVSGFAIFLAFWGFSRDISPYYLPEFITIAWVVAELGLLSGIWWRIMNED